MMTEYMNIYHFGISNKMKVMKVFLLLVFTSSKSIQSEIPKLMKLLIIHLIICLFKYYLKDIIVSISDRIEIKYILYHLIMFIILLYWLPIML